MSPRTGRPKSKNPKNVKLTLQIAQDTAEKLQECADEMGTSRVAVIEKGIEKVWSDIKKK